MDHIISVPPKLARRRSAPLSLGAGGIGDHGRLVKTPGKKPGKSAVATLSFDASGHEAELLLIIA